MKVYAEISWENFKFWGGASETEEILTVAQMDYVWMILEDSYPEGISKTSINDFFWNERDTIAAWLGFSSWEELVENNEEEA